MSSCFGTWRTSWRASAWTRTPSKQGRKRWREESLLRSVPPPPAVVWAPPEVHRDRQRQCQEKLKTKYPSNKTVVELLAFNLDSNSLSIFVRYSDNIIILTIRTYIKSVYLCSYDILRCWELVLNRGNNNCTPWDSLPKTSRATGSTRTVFRSQALDVP